MDKHRARAYQPEWKLDFPVNLRCPFDAGISVTLYVDWSDVPDWWPCTCGAEHQKQHPRGAIVATGS